MTLQPGDTLPDLALAGPDGPVRLHDLLHNGPLLILFYEEDSTPTCTTQLCSFRDDWDMIEELGASAAAISADHPDSHRRFADDAQLPFPLLSDLDLQAAQAFGVSQSDTRRAHRAAFVADPHGVIQLAIPLYQPSNLDHYQSVFAALGLDL